MDLQLAGRRALVTASGIGEATVRLLDEEGAIAVVRGRERKRAARASGCSWPARTLTTCCPSSSL